MAQVAARAGTTKVGRGRRGRAARLFRIVSAVWACAFRRSRERDELGAAMSLARVGRETGVKC
jgi:hypothetical protein